MTTKAMTLQDLLVADGEDRSPAVTDALAARNLGVPGVAAAVAAKLAEGLDIGLGDLLARAWNRHRALRRAGAASLLAPGDDILVPLASHRVRSTHRPAVEIELVGQSLEPVVFDVEVEATLEGVTLVVRDGRLCRLLAGRTRVAGTLRLGDAILVERTTAWLDLPGAVSLGEGLAIPGLDAPTDRTALEAAA